MIGYAAFLYFYTLFDIIPFKEEKMRNYLTFTIILLTTLFVTACRCGIG
jgi:hypothetical protein